MTAPESPGRPPARDLLFAAAVLVPVALACAYALKVAWVAVNVWSGAVGWGVGGGE